MITTLIEVNVVENREHTEILGALERIQVLVTDRNVSTYQLVQKELLQIRVLLTAPLEREHEELITQTLNKLSSLCVKCKFLYLVTSPVAC